MKLIPFGIYRFYSSLKKKCAKNVSKKLTKWIKLQQPGPFSLNADQPTSNVFIADFIELNDFEFCRTVIGLNNKIFNESTIIERDSNDNNDNLNKIENNSDDECECIESNTNSWCFIFKISKPIFLLGKKLFL